MRFVAIIFLLFVLVLLFYLIRYYTNSVVIPKNNSFAQPENQMFPPEKFTGKITNINLACTFDGEFCSVTVSGKEVIFAEGHHAQFYPGKVEQPVWGAMGFGVTDAENFLDRRVEVYAVPTSIPFGKYTLKGNKDYYIKLLK